MRALPAGRIRPQPHPCAPVPRGQGHPALAAASARLEAARTPEAAARVRGELRLVLAEWGVHDAAREDLSLIATELVTNAVQHGTAGRIRVCLDLRATILVVTVADQTPYVPLPRAVAAGANSERGRGLFLVEALAEDWGHGPMEGPGTAVWARYRLAPLR
ncbi:ATP-binding protein [Actinacidiphila sp. bgisy144]|uniref:ATP-binding protein n=1 Tax=Actinacidiphila sp. bgisy144 TaxID=3413791 RepID=UPI003EBF0409